MFNYNVAFFQGLWDKLWQQHICSVIPASIGVGSEENRQCRLKVNKVNMGGIVEYIALHLKFRRRESEVFYWPICLSTGSRWQISWLDIRPTLALTWIWLPDPLYSWYNIKPQKIQVWLDMRHVGNQYDDALQNDNALMYHFISKLFNDMDLFVMWNKERVCWMIKLSWHS